MLQPYLRPKRFFFVIFISLFIVSCKKDIDVTADQLTSSVSDNATTPDLNACKIRRIYQGVGGFVQSALFSYNRAGNPYSILYTNNGTGNRNHFFIYDSQNRLTEWRQQYGDFIVEHHYYRYNALNQIFRDSTISFEAGGHYESVSTIEYDAQGRVVKETIENVYAGGNPLEPVRRPTFTYDSRGNLGVLGWKSSSYDYKINPLRQNKVFQFLMRNYSRNNPAVQPKYNSLGLPLSLHPSNDSFFNSGVTYKIIYDCQ